MSRNFFNSTFEESINEIVNVTEFDDVENTEDVVKNEAINRRLMLSEVKSLEDKQNEDNLKERRSLFLEMEKVNMMISSQIQEEWNFDSFLSSNSFNFTSKSSEPDFWNHSTRIGNINSTGIEDSSVYIPVPPNIALHVDVHDYSQLQNSFNLNSTGFEFPFIHIDTQLSDNTRYNLHLFQVELSNSPPEAFYNTLILAENHENERSIDETSFAFIDCSNEEF